VNKFAIFVGFGGFKFYVYGFVAHGAGGEVEYLADATHTVLLHGIIPLLKFGCICILDTQTLTNPA
jgi:hypothetical protein